MLKINEKITMFSILATLLLICSLSTISAANHTINPGDTGGILQGIADTDIGDTLFLSNGTYNKTNQDTNITINKSITIQGIASTENVIIDARELSRIFTINNSINVRFINITFTNGNVIGVGNGGAVVNAYANTMMTFINCSFINNKAPTNGGAIYNLGDNLKILDCNFESNNANYAGAVYNAGVNMNIYYSNFINNNVTNGVAALLNTANGVNSMLNNCNFTNNNAIGGAGGLSNAATNMSIFVCNFNSNSAGYGGAIYNTGVNMNISACNFTSNKANSAGSAIRNAGGNMTVSICNFNSNNANNGTIHNTGTININSNTISNNVAEGIYNGYTANIENNNIVGNTGDGIMNGGIVNIIGNNITKNTGKGVNNNGEAILAKNIISSNTNQVIHNNGIMYVLNLTYLDNSTKKVLNNTQVIIYATLTDDMGNPITGQNISFYVDGILIGTVESIEGKANITYTPNTLGIIPVTGDYEGSGTYNININPGQLNIVLKFNTNSTIVVPDNVKVGKTINITGVLTDEFGNTIANVDLDVTVDGKTYTVKTDNNGKWVLVYKPTHTGNVLASVSYSGNDTYFGCTENKTFNVKKGDIIVTINVTENNDGSITIIANATDEDGDPVIDYPVDFIIDGKIVGNGTTDQNGIAKITIPANKVGGGTPQITVIVNGVENFNDGTKNTLFDTTGSEKPNPKPKPIPKPKPSPKPPSPKPDQNNNNPAAHAAMKNTGIPIIAILLVLLTSLGLIARKKQ